jgi:outer membrane protein assembly factor BamB
MVASIMGHKGKSRLKLAIGILAVLTLAGCTIFEGNGGPKTPVLGKRVSILNSASGLDLDPALADVAVTLPAAEANVEWDQPGGNPAKAMGHVALAAAPKRIWTARILGSTARARLASPPVISGGKLFVIDTDANVRAFNAATGAALWSTDLGAKANSASDFGGGVSASGDRVFADNGVGEVFALDAATGKQVWKVRPGGPLRGAPTVAFGQVYVISQDNQLFALNEVDGKLEWNDSGTLQTTAVFGVAAPAAGQGTVIAGYSSGELTAYRYENGRTLWGDALSRSSIATSVAALTDIDADPVIDRGLVFAIGQGGRMASYELTTGQRRWELNIAGISTPWVVGEWVFVVTDEAKMLCVARATGKIRWISQLRQYRVQRESTKKDQIRWKGPILAGGKLYVVNTLGVLATVNPADGKVLSSSTSFGPMTLPPVVANNILYILQDDGVLIAMK